MTNFYSTENSLLLPFDLKKVKRFGKWIIDKWGYVMQVTLFVIFSYMICVQRKAWSFFFNMLKMENERDSTLTLVDVWKISLLPAAASYNDLVLDSLKPTAPH